jgi:hypothetical protein
MSACQCSPCGRHFTSLTAFDRHQAVDYRRRPAVLCVDPAKAGLVRQASGRWASPSMPVPASGSARSGQAAHDGTCQMRVTGPRRRSSPGARPDTGCGRPAVLKRDGDRST